MQCVWGEGTRQRPGDVELETVPEQVQPYTRTRHRIVPVRDRIHQRLEHCPLAELWTLYARGELRGTHQHVPAHEMQRPGHLLVEGSTDVAGVCLVIHVGALAGVADRLHVGVRQPPLRLARAQQDAGECKPCPSVIVIGYEAELVRRIPGGALLNGVFAEKSARQRVVQIVRAGAGDPAIRRSVSCRSGCAAETAGRELRETFHALNVQACENSRRGSCARTDFAGCLRK